MATTTYNFVGVNNPAGTASNKACRGRGSSIPTPPAATELTSANYDSVESQNNVGFYYGCTTVGQYDYVTYRFYVTDTGITKYTGFVRGYGEE